MVTDLHGIPMSTLMNNNQFHEERLSMQQYNMKRSRARVTLAGQCLLLQTIIKMPIFSKKRKKYPNMDYIIRKCIVQNNNSNYFVYLGYKPVDLKKHLESLFTKGMSWDEFKKGNIHIDHIKPQSSFNLHEDKEIKKCWSLNNLQPLWKKDNLIKSNKYNIKL